MRKEKGRNMGNDMHNDNFAARRHNADSTNSMVVAVSSLSKRDFTKSMGSGVLLLLTDYTTGHAITEEFTIAAEDMEVIKVEIIASLRRSLEFRRAARQREIADIDNAITKCYKTM